MTTNQSLEQRLLKASIAINNALSREEIKVYLEKYGYTEERLNIGLNLLNEVKKLGEDKDKRYGNQYKASDEFEETFKEIQKSYSRFRRLARVAFRENAYVLRSLGLLIKTQNSLSGFLKQSRQFYNTAREKEEILTGLAKFGVSKEELEVELPKLDHIERLKENQEYEKSTAQQSTKDRDEAIDKLDRWLLDFYEIARIALEEKPQYIEMLGIVEPS
jgi:hypothetical protein